MGRLTWIGHSTVLVELDGARLLTDPVLRPRIGHLRRTSPADRAALGGLDAALVSHVHYDHLDLPSLRQLGPSVPLVVPRGAGALLRRRGFREVVELGPGETAAIGALTVRATHAEHETRRSPLGPAVPSLGFLIDGSARVYFAGDTDLFDGMSAFAPGLDVALLPVAGWGPRLPPGHLDPLRAAQSLRLLRPRLAVPIHWGTYRRIGLAADPVALRGPAESFERYAAELAPEVDVHVLPAGGSLELSGARAEATA